MNPAQLFAHFHRLAEAPDAIPRLRRFILDLAVRGKLVPQDPKDEPISTRLALSDEVRRETSKHDRRADAGTQQFLADDLKWVVPDAWTWRPLADLVLFIDYRGQTPNKTTQGVRLITAKNVKKGFINPSPEEFLSDDDYPKWMTRGIPKIGDVLFTTEAPMGNAAVVNLVEPFALAQRVIDFRSYGSIDSDFLVLQILADSFQSILDKVATGLTAKGIKASKLKCLPIALPPLVEQRRIVAKVDELVALCDQLEAAQTERERRRDRLVVAIHAALSTPTTEARQASFAIRQFSNLSARPEHIAHLRQTILNLAVRGKLVGQFLDGESAGEFLNRIQAEKVKRASDGLMRKQEPLQKVRPDEKWFEIPESWEWVRLGSITHIVMGQSPPGETYNKSGEGIPLINGPVEFTEGPFGKTFINQYTTAPTNLCEEGDLLLCVRGSTTGRTNIAGFRACIGRGVAAIRPFFADHYVRLFIWRLRASIIAMGRGIAFPSVNKQQIENLPVPLPPLAEQHCIVAKVEELLDLCDRLEARLARTQIESRRLLDSVLHEALAPAA